MVLIEEANNSTPNPTRLLRGRFLGRRKAAPSRSGVTERPPTPRPRLPSPPHCQLALLRLGPPARTPGEAKGARSPRPRPSPSPWVCRRADTLRGAARLGAARRRATFLRAGTPSPWPPTAPDPGRPPRPQPFLFLPSGRLLPRGAHARPRRSPPPCALTLLISHPLPGVRVPLTQEGRQGTQAGRGSVESRQSAPRSSA